jgi:hypothetical protein
MISESGDLNPLWLILFIPLFVLCLGLGLSIIANTSFNSKRKDKNGHNL